MRMTAWLGVFFLVAMVGAGNYAAAEKEVLYSAVFNKVDLKGGLPQDLLQPEGKTEWDLTGMKTVGAFKREVTNQMITSEQARQWLLPQENKDFSNPSVANLYFKDENGPGELWIQIRYLGNGLLKLPARKDPHVVVLQLVQTFRRSAQTNGYIFERQTYRWVDPRAGVVAEIWGAVENKGFVHNEIKSEVQGAYYLNELKTDLAPLKIYADQIDLPTLQRLAYGFEHKKTCSISGAECTSDCGSGGTCGITISTLTSPSYTTIGDLVNAGSWTFSLDKNNLTTSASQWASLAVPVNNSSETCNYSNFFGSGSYQCGIDAGGPNLTLLREDRGFDDPWTCSGGGLCGPGGSCSGFLNYCVHNSILTVTQGQDNAVDYTVWFRAGRFKEGQPGAFGAGESGLCYGRFPGDGYPSGNKRPEVPLYRFAWKEGSRYYMQLHDTWANTPIFECSQAFMSHRCPSGCGLACPGWGNQCTTGGQFYSGTFSGEVVAEGFVTLPSGHIFQALVIKNVAEFCSWGNSSCSGIIPATPIRTVIYYIVAPYLGTVARLQSAQRVDDTVSFTQLDQSDIKYGLFPPMQTKVDGKTANSIALSWNPGLPTGVPNRLTGYKVYWGTQSGNYPFDSVKNPGQVTFNGASATVSGLTSGVTYYFTVTSLSNYRNPASQQTTTFESLKYPTTVPTNDLPLPMEVTGTTSCPLTKEVKNLVVSKEAGGALRMCWDQPSDSCVRGYRLLRSGNPASASGWTTLADVDGATTLCQGGLVDNNSFSSYLVISRGIDGTTGPWGHYDQKAK